MSEHEQAELARDFLLEPYDYTMETADPPELGIRVRPETVARVAAVMTHESTSLPITTAEAAELAGFVKPTAVKVLGGMAANGMLDIELDKRSGGGRRARLYTPLQPLDDAVAQNTLWRREKQRYDLRNGLECSNDDELDDRLLLMAETLLDADPLPDGDGVARALQEAYDYGDELPGVAPQMDGISPQTVQQVAVAARNSGGRAFDVPGIAEASSLPYGTVAQIVKTLHDDDMVALVGNNRHAGGQFRLYVPTDRLYDGFEADSDWRRAWQAGSLATRLACGPNELQDRMLGAAYLVTDMQ